MESLKIIDELKQGLWVSSGTRFVSLDFTVYNANINLFCIVKYVKFFSDFSCSLFENWAGFIKFTAASRSNLHHR